VHVVGGVGPTRRAGDAKAHVGGKGACRRGVRPPGLGASVELPPYLDDPLSVGGVTRQGRRQAPVAPGYVLASVGVAAPLTA
jgi:hypothetical protein